MRFIDPPARKTIRVDLVFDVACPWCFIGFRRMRRALFKRPSVLPKFHWWPFMLDPDIPPGGMHYRLYLATKFGDENRAENVIKRIRDVGRDTGISFNFNRVSTMPSTADAHRLLLYAERNNSLIPLLDQIFCGYFENGLDIERHAVLMELAGCAGLDPGDALEFLESDEDRDTVLGRAASAIGLGIQGVPTFIFDKTYLVSGAMDAESLLRPIDVAAANSPKF